MKAMPLAVGLLCLIPLIGLAEPSLSRPGVRPNPEARAGEIKSQRKSLKEFTPSEEQVVEAERFFEANSPFHFRAYKKAMERSGLHQFLRKWIAHNHLDLKAVENTDPQLFAMKLDQLQIEDKIFGIVADAREKGVMQRDRLRAELQPVLRDLVAKRKEEASHRIERMKLAMEAEQKQLDEMNEHPEPWIEARITEELARGGRLFLPPDPRRVAPVPAPTTSAH